MSSSSSSSVYYKYMYCKWWTLGAPQHLLQARCLYLARSLYVYVRAEVCGCGLTQKFVSGFAQNPQRFWYELESSGFGPEFSTEGQTSWEGVLCCLMCSMPPLTNVFLGKTSWEGVLCCHSFFNLTTPRECTLRGFASCWGLGFGV
jgi:hypothetical protein